MGRQILPLTVDRLPLLVEPCRTCLFWESTPAHNFRPVADPVDAKGAWLREALAQWGSPGRIALVDGVPAGYVTYAPAHLVPRATAFPTAPVSEDAVVLLTARIAGGYAGQGLGRALVQRAAKDVLGHGVRAIEVFATTSAGRATAGAYRRGHRSDALTRTAWGSRHQRGTSPSAPGEEGLERTDARSRRPAEEVPPLALDSRVAESAPSPRRRPLALDIGTVPKVLPPVGRAPQALADDTTGVVTQGRTLSGPIGFRSDDAAGEPGQAADGERPEGSPHDAAASPPPAWRPQHCLLPVQFLTAVGFYPVREHPLYPRMRLDLRTALRWSEDLGLAVERLFTPVRALPGGRPVGSVH